MLGPDEMGQLEWAWTLRSMFLVGRNTSMQSFRLFLKFLLSISSGLTTAQGFRNITISNNRLWGAWSTREVRHLPKNPEYMCRVITNKDECYKGEQCKNIHQRKLT